MNRESTTIDSVDIVTGIFDTCHYYRYCLFGHNDELLRTVSDFLDPDGRKSGRRVTIVTGNGKALNAKRKPMRVVIKLFFDSFTKLYLKSESNPMCRVNRYSSPAPPSPRTSSSVFRRFSARALSKSGDSGEHYLN
jgi:hypothetical protein